MDSPLVEITAKVGQLQQSQDSLDNQLRELHAVANKLGLYDAADWLIAMLYRGHVDPGLHRPTIESTNTNPENVLPARPVHKQTAEEFKQRMEDIHGES